MNSTVRFQILETGEEFQLTLVYPKDVQGQSDRISVLAPVGSALLGLSVGHELEWPRPGGGVTTVKVVEVVYQPERAGDLHSSSLTKTKVSDTIFLDGLAQVLSMA